MPGSACCRCSLLKCPGSTCWQSFARELQLSTCRCARSLAGRSRSPILLAVKICESLKMLAQLLRPLGSPSKELSLYCKGSKLQTSKLQGLLQLCLVLLLVQAGKCLCSLQSQVLFPFSRCLVKRAWDMGRWMVLEGHLLRDLVAGCTRGGQRPSDLIFRSPNWK